MIESHVVSEPPILYFGTPVVLISTLNADGSANLSPISSVFWLGWRAMLGLDASSKATENMARSGELVLNLPSASEVDAVDRLARLTGTDPVPPAKRMRGYRYEPDKFGAAGLTELTSQTVAPPRVLECPVQLEAVVVHRHDLMADDALCRGLFTAWEVRVTRVHVRPDLLAEGTANRIDPDKWRPLIMSFQKFYGLAEGELRPSALAAIPEASYLTPDVARARAPA